MSRLREDSLDKTLRHMVENLNGAYEAVHPKGHPRAGKRSTCSGTAINELNEKGLKIYNAARAKFADSPDVAEFCKYYEQLLGGKPWEESETPPPVDDNIMLPTEKPLEVEIIPPARRLQAAPIERMMEVIEVEPPKHTPAPARCRHGNLDGSCHVIDVGKDQCPHWYDQRKASRYFA